MNYLMQLFKNTEQEIFSLSLATATVTINVETSKGNGNLLLQFAQNVVEARFLRNITG